ncbi:hypothetical protein PFISCL1PPCAC_27108, partial [Pristionchus fissidentatus]
AAAAAAPHPQQQPQTLLEQMLSTGSQQQQQQMQQPAQQMQHGARDPTPVSRMRTKRGLGINHAFYTGPLQGAAVPTTQQHQMQQEPMQPSMQHSMQQPQQTPPEMQQLQQLHQATHPPIQQNMQPQPTQAQMLQHLQQLQMQQALHQQSHMQQMKMQQSLHPQMQVQPPPSQILQQQQLVHQSLQQVQPPQPQILQPLHQMQQQPLPQPIQQPQPQTQPTQPLMLPSVQQMQQPLQQPMQQMQQPQPQVQYPVAITSPPPQKLRRKEDAPHPLTEPLSQPPQYPVQLQQQYESQYVQQQPAMQQLQQPTSVADEQWKAQMLEYQAMQAAMKERAAAEAKLQREQAAAAAAASVQHSPSMQQPPLVSPGNEPAMRHLRLDDEDDEDVEDEDTIEAERLHREKMARMKAEKRAIKKAKRAAVREAEAKNEQQGSSQQPPESSNAPWTSSKPVPVDDPSSFGFYNAQPPIGGTPSGIPEAFAPRRLWERKTDEEGDDSDPGSSTSSQSNGESGSTTRRNSDGTVAPVVYGSVSIPITDENRERIHKMMEEEEKRRNLDAERNNMEEMRESSLERKDSAARRRRMPQFDPLQLLSDDGVSIFIRPRGPTDDPAPFPLDKPCSSKDIERREEEDIAFDEYAEREGSKVKHVMPQWKQEQIHAEKMAKQREEKERRRAERKKRMEEEGIVVDEEMMIKRDQERIKRNIQWAKKEEEKREQMKGKVLYVPREPPSQTVAEEIGRTLYNMDYRLKTSGHNSRRDTSPYFLHPRPSDMEKYNLKVPHGPNNGFGYINTQCVTDEQVTPQDIQTMLRRLPGLKKELIEDEKGSNGMSMDESTSPCEKKMDSSRRFSVEYDDKDQLKEGQIQRNVLQRHDQTFGISRMKIETERSKRKANNMGVKQEEEDMDFEQDDPDYDAQNIGRRRRILEKMELAQKAEKAERARLAQQAAELNFQEHGKATVWNAHYANERDQATYDCKQKWDGIGPVDGTVVPETGSGTYGSKGPHKVPSQKIKKLAWSLQQVVQMLDKVTKNQEVTSAQYMLACQHYACMIQKTPGAHSKDPAQKRLADAAMAQIIEMGGGMMTYQQLDPYDISKLFSNHLQNQVEKNAERSVYKTADPVFEVEIVDEISKVLADIKGTDAEGLFSRKEIDRALRARQDIIDGKKNIVDKELMEVDEIKSPTTTLYENHRKEKRRVEGQSEKIDIHDAKGLQSMEWENGELTEDDPLQPVLENAFTASHLNDILHSPSEYMKTFRSKYFSEDVPLEWQQEEDEEMRYVVPPAEGNEEYLPFDGKEREFDHPTCTGEEPPPIKRLCECDEASKKEECSWGKHHHYPPGATREMIDASFILYRYRIDRKEKKGVKGELFNFAKQFNCPKVCMSRLSDMEPHAARNLPPNYSWCAVNYYERDIRQGVMKQVTSPNYFIDGGFEWKDDLRYSVGILTNNAAIDDGDVATVRRRIGGGVRISVKEDGAVWVRVLSRYPIFISSTFLDRQAGRVGGDAVHKVYPGGAIQCFDLIRARRTILQMYDYQWEANKVAQNIKKLRDLPHPLNHFNRRELRSISRIGSDDLQRHCVIKISFCKGWGPEYEYARPYELPCWVEVVVNRGCEFIDHIMHIRHQIYAMSDQDSSDYND